MKSQLECCQLENDRWGIYCGCQLLATIKTRQECEKLREMVNGRLQKQPPIPEEDANLRGEAPSAQPLAVGAKS